MRTMILAATLLAATPASAAEPTAIVPDPVFTPALRALFDVPMATLRTTLPPRETGDPAGVARCYRYADLTVQEVDYGEHGDDSIFFTPHEDGKPLPTCGPVPGRFEKTLFSSEESYFLGARGLFAFVVSTAGRDGTPFTIHDLVDNMPLYGDDMATDTQPTRYEAAGNSLKLQYVRAAKGSCSIVSGGAACWKAFAAEAKLPPEIANAPAPVTLCAKGYAAAFGTPASADEPSVLNYTVTVTLDASRENDNVFSPGVLVSCNPQS